MNKINKKTQKKLNEIENEMILLSSADRFNRARSITVGTAFNGVCEIMMRGDNKMLWCILQPAEVIELIHQLAANVGCHINLQPRNDFSSWRKWNNSNTTDSQPGLSFPPHANAPSIANQPSPEFKVNVPIKGESNEQTVATEKTVGRKRAKRAPAAA